MLAPNTLSHAIVLLATVCLDLSTLLCFCWRPASCTSELPETRGPRLASCDKVINLLVAGFSLRLPKWGSSVDQSYRYLRRRFLRARGIDCSSDCFLGYCNCKRYLRLGATRKQAELVQRRAVVILKLPSSAESPPALVPFGGVC